MNTIAITIDEDTARLLEDLTRRSQPRRSRSSLVRAAIREFAERELRRSQEERERAVLRKHRTRLPRISAARRDFLTLTLKSKLTGFVSELPPAKIAELDAALARALDLPIPAPMTTAR